MQSIFKVPEFMTTTSGAVLIYMMALILSERFTFTLSEFVSVSIPILIFGIMSFTAMGVIIRLIGKVSSKIVRLLFSIVFIFISVYWALALFLLMIYKATVIGDLVV